MLYVLSTRGWCFIFDMQEADCFIHHTYFYLYILLLHCTFNIVIRHFRNIDKSSWTIIYSTMWKIDLNGVVTQVNRLMKVFNLERLGAESECLSYVFIRFLNIFSGWWQPEVGGLVHPDDQGVPVGDEHPLADVELGVVDEERPLDVLLHNVPGEGEVLQHNRRPNFIFGTFTKWARAKVHVHNISWNTLEEICNR